MSQPDKLSEWITKWRNNFGNMKPNSAYCIENCAKDKELFIMVCKNWIDYYPNGHQFEISNCGKYFKRTTNQKL